MVPSLAPMPVPAVMENTPESAASVTLLPVSSVSIVWLSSALTV
jgi:hypothetical protein